MMVILCFYTVVIVTINIVEHTSSNLLPPGYDIAHMTSQDIAERTLGSKLILVVEESQMCVIWGAKTCLVIMYLRLTTLRRENLAIKALLVYVGVTFVVMEILYLGVWCRYVVSIRIYVDRSLANLSPLKNRPFKNYWAVPTPNVQCDAATNHLITNAVFNLTSDVAMLAVGLPMFLRLSLRLSKKIPLIGIFSLGIFVIVAAILNKVYSFSDPFSDEWVYWYVRESSTALIVANLPFVWLFYRKIFHIRSSTASRGYGSNAHTATRISSMRRKSGKAQPDLPGLRKNSERSDSNLELGGMGEAGLWSDNMTAEEMLRGDVLSSAHAKNATPFTHPALFFADGSRKPPSVPPCPELPELAVLSDYGERQTARRGSSPDLRFNSTPVSSNFTDGGNGPKAGSFV
jgi:hypothetical protein